MVYPQPLGQSTSTPNTAGTAITVASPGTSQGVSYKVGDFIVFALRGQSSNTTAVALPSGVVRLGPAFLASNASYRVTGLYGYRVLGDANGSPVVPASFTFTMTGSSTSRLVLIAQVVRNVDKDNPVDSFYNSYFGEVYTRGVRIPSYATTSDGLTVVIAASEFAANNSENPTLQDNDYGVYGQVVAPTTLSSGRTSVGLYMREQAAGSTNEFIMQWGTPSGQAAQSVTLRGGAWPTTPVTPVLTGPTIEYVKNGAIVAAEVLYRKAGTLLSVDRALKLPRRRITVARWLSEKPSYMIHRGGSVDWAEHTMRAYTNAVWLGARNIEVSVWFSTDDVAYACHDADLASMTNGTDTRRIDALSSAELDQVVITKAGAGSGEKLVRLSTIIAKFGDYCVITIEDKSYSHMVQLIALLQSMYPKDAVTRFIIKAFGAGGTGHMTLPNSLGFASWGYFYTAAGQIAPEQVPEKARLYTTIGIPWDTPQSVVAGQTNTGTYDGAKSLGIPLIIHIVPSAAAAQTARDRAGDQLVGMQISSPLAVIPRLNEPLS